MAVTISEFVKEVGISKTYLDKRCTDEHLSSIARFIDWRTIAPHLGLTETEIEDIEDEDRKNEVRRLKTLQRWKMKCCFKATYKKLVEVFLHIERADHAEKLCTILRSAFSGEQEACCDADVATQLCLPSATPRSSLPGESPIVPRRTGTLEEEIDALEGHFLDLVNTTADSFIDANLSLPRLKRCLTQLPVSAKVRHIKFLAGNLVNILKAENIEEIFAILGLYWDFLNCGLLVEMIHRFEKSLPDVNHELEKYLHKLRLFRCQTKVKEFIDNWLHTLPPFFGNLTLELDEVWMDRTLEELEEFIKEVCRKHAFEPYSVLLKKVESGSVALTCAVQSSFATRKLSVQISQSFLIQRGVLRVTFRKTCVYRLKIPQVIQVQYLVRMWLARKARLQYFEDCVDAIIKIQAFWRAVRARREYKQLAKSDKPSASVISRFLALDVREQVDSDFAQELSKDQLSRKGGKNRKRGKNQDDKKKKRELRFKDYLQEYAQVKRVLGGCWLQAYCFDGKDRRCHIPGHFRKRVSVQEGDIILVSLRDYQDEVADIIHKYYRGEARSLVALEEIPKSVDLTYTSVKYEDEAAGDFRVDFDYYGYLRNPDEYHRIRSTGVLNKDDDEEYYESLEKEGIQGPVI